MNKKTNGKVFVALSGGVDSSVAAALLQKECYEVTGVFMKIWVPEYVECPWKQERLDAMRVAAHLGIPFHTFDLSEEYKQKVGDYMIEEYRAGRTPNPDVFCNTYIKFGVFLDRAREMGADYVATGHYARLEREFPISNFQFPNKDGKDFKKLNIENLLKIEKCKLKISKDLNKDQTYFLWNLTQEQLRYTLFPVGDLVKPEVRELAKKFGLATAEKKDSQGVCFIGKLDMREFLKQAISSQSGAVLDEAGQAIGDHEGAAYYTIGQRHGFVITKGGTDDSPRYVIAKDMEKNTITVAGRERCEEPSFGARVLRIRAANWIADAPKAGRRYTARVRYRQPLQEVQNIEPVVADSNDTVWRIYFLEHQKTVAPGQSVVVYDGEECIGGGIIEGSER